MNIKNILFKIILARYTVYIMYNGHNIMDTLTNSNVNWKKRGKITPNTKFVLVVTNGNEE